MKLVVFTTILGPLTDPLRPVRLRNPDVHYLCFADHHVRAPGWEIIRVPPEPPPNIHSRRLKILSHQTLEPWKPDASLWVDAAFEMTTDPAPVALQWLDGVDMVALRHPHRDTILQEGEQIIRLGMVEPELIARQLACARAAGFRADTQPAITSTGFCLRRHTDVVARFNERWWSLFQQAGHGRDQMSVDWALWESPVPMRYLEGHYKNNPYARWHPASAFLRRQQARHTARLRSRAQSATT